ncbi:MAG: S8 family peptidase [Bacteroidota bacterium]
MKLHRILFFITASLIVLATACTEETIATQELASTNTLSEFVPNEVLVKFKFKSVGQAGGRSITNLLSLVDGEVVETISTNAMKSSAARNGVESEVLLLVHSKVGTMEAIARFKKLSEVVYAEPNWIYTLCTKLNDTYYLNGSLWGMYGDVSAPSNIYGSHAATAWANGHTGLQTVYVGIIDKGYMYTHEDLAANAGTNPGEIDNNGIDDDGNGLIDDIYGWDFAGNNNTVFDGTVDDHGTHIAGTIGGAGGNGKGITGVCPNVKLLNAKLFGQNGGTVANAIKAVDYFTDLKRRHRLNLVATNNSWTGGEFSQSLEEAIERANRADILFIAAAGNGGSNNDTDPSYPASYPNANIITVASITSTGALSFFSQYGAASVDIGAPGSGIWSTYPITVNSQVVSDYASLTGTSMATAYVTGAAALYAASNPGATAAQIKSAILNSATPTPSLTGKCVTGGRLNVSGF